MYNRRLFFVIAVVLTTLLCTTLNGQAASVKERMLASHDSQRSWLREQHGEDEYLLWMRRTARDRARDFGKKRVKYAEGFTQHRGNAFPREDPLTPVLGKRRVKTVRPR